MCFNSLHLLSYWYSSGSIWLNGSLASLISAITKYARLILYISQSRSGNLPFIQGNMVSFSETLYSMMKIWMVVLFIATEWLLSVGFFSIYTHNFCMCIYKYMYIYNHKFYSYFQLRFRSIGILKNLTLFLKPYFLSPTRKKSPLFSMSPT